MEKYNNFDGTGMSLWRSDTMIKVQITSPINMIHDMLKSLVDSNSIHIIDQNPNTPAFQRKYFSLLSKIVELQTKFTNIRTQVEVNKNVQIPVQIQNSQLSNMQSLEKYLDTINSELKQVQQDLQSHRKSESALLGKYLALKNINKIMDKQLLQTTIHQDIEAVDNLLTIVFVSSKSLTLPIMKSMYSVTQSNIEFQVQELEEEIDGQQADLLAGFITGSVAYEKCRKVLQSFGLNQILIEDDYQSQFASVEEQLQNIRKTIDYVQLTQIRILEDCSAYIDFIDDTLETEKIVVNAMNQFEFTETNAKITAWVPEKRYERFDNIIEQYNKKYVNQGQVIVQKLDYNYKKDNPPTFFPLSHLTESFHYLVTAYGIPNYKEINPAFFYLFHFNFTFAIMFGDVCHGLINGLAALAFIIFSKKLKNSTSDIIQLLFTGRYLIFTMSIFSILVGFIYNDYFALAFNVFDTQYTWQGSNGKYTGVWPDDTKPYLPKYGIDAFWHWASNNSMVFLNSYKMKLSVVVGITQMLIGVFLKLLNCIYYKDWKKVICTWIPELLFLGGFFGYMVFCIIYKWMQYWPEGSNPPSLINLLIAIFLSPGSVDSVNQLFNDIDKQNQVQLFVFSITIISLVWMMIASPIWTIIYCKKHPEEPKPVMADLWVNTIINCIEYVLGCISHTASYLRLWALSLSHSELAEIFFDELIGISIGLDFDQKWQTIVFGGLSLIITYAAWFACTIAILCLMECLSAFLHALRLVWIEFNNKFFIAEGYQFQPLDLPEGRFTIEQTSQMARDD